MPVKTIHDVGQRHRPGGPNPLVSVIIPCYNYAHFLPDAIGSALRQDGVDVEIIVVNDASTDDSASVAVSFQQRHPQVRLLDNKTNTGHVVAFNNGYALPKGNSSSGWMQMICLRRVHCCGRWRFSVPSRRSDWCMVIHAISVPRQPPMQ